MRFQSRFSTDPDLDTVIRWVERPPSGAEVLAPRAWTSPQVEAWLDWAASLPAGYPSAALAEGLIADRPFGPLLGGALERYARRIAAWSHALGLFPRSEDALAFKRDLVLSMAAGEAAPGGPGEGRRLDRLCRVTRALWASILSIDRSGAR